MRILFIAPYTPLLTKPRPYNFIMHLAKQHEVVLLCFGDIPLSVLEQRPDYQKLKSHCKHIAHIPLTKAKIAMNLAYGLFFSPEPLRVNYYGPDFAQDTIREIINQYHIEAIHIDRSRFAGLASGIDLPKVLDLTDSLTWYIEQCLSHAPLYLKPMYQLELTRMRRFERSVGLSFDQCLITSAYDKARFKDTGFYERINVVPNAVDQAFFANEITEPETDNTLLFFGNLSYRPNVDGVTHFCSHIFPQIQRQNERVSLHIIGNQPARVVQRLQRKPGIKITGWVPSLIDYIASVTAVISPMRIGVGFPNKVAESLALGKAVICTDIGCRGLPGSEQVLRVAHNDKEFAEVTVDLLRKPDIRKQLEKRALTYARESINPDSALEALDSVYAKL